MDTNTLIEWRKLSWCTAPNSQVLVMESRARLSWQLSVQYQQNGIRQLPSHPVSSQFLGTVTKDGNNCIKTSDLTRSKTWTLRSYLSNIHMHVVILLVAVSNTLVTTALFFYHLLSYFHLLTFMEPCIVVWIVAITNEMQLSKGIYYSTVH